MVVVAIDAADANDDVPNYMVGLRPKPCGSSDSVAQPIKRVVITPDLRKQFLHTNI
jgi:hypothetical protein